MEPAPASALVRTLARHARRQRAAVLLRTLAAVLSIGVTITPLLVVLDVLALPLPLRWAAWSTAVLIIVGVSAWLSRHLLRRKSYVAVAHDLEMRAGIDDGLLASGWAFHQQSPRDASSWMIDRTIALADKAAFAINAWPVISPIPWRLPVLAVAVTCLLGIGVVIPSCRPWLIRALYPGSDLGRPGDLRVVALGGDRVVPVGSEPRLAVEIEGAPATGTLPVRASHVIASITWQDGRTEQRAMALIPKSAPTALDLWHVTLPPVTRALTWSAAAFTGPGEPARGESDRLHLGITPGLVPTHLQLRIIPPAYTHLPTTTVTGDCAALAGSQLELEAHITSGFDVTSADTVTRLVAATVMLDSLDNSPAVEIPATVSTTGPRGDAHIRATWIVRRSQTWGLRLIAGGGHETLPERHWHVSVANDLSPLTHLARVPASMAADAQTAVAMSAEDDVALADTVLEIRRDHGGGALLNTLPIPDDSTRQRAATLLIDGAVLGLHPGDTVALVPVASDRAGQTTRGDPVLVTVTVNGADLDQAVTQLEHVTTAVADAHTALAALSDAWDRCGVEATARAVLAGRFTAWRTALVQACATWEMPQVADPTTGPKNSTAHEIRRALHDLAWWCTTATNDVLTELNEQPITPVAPGRVRFASDELRALSTSVQRLREAIAHAHFRRVAEAESRACRRHGDALLADLAWQVGAAPGLLTKFSRDANDAPETAGGIELPAVQDRELPGLGREHIRIRWHGALFVAHADQELELLADDGVALTVAGIARLPAEAWNDHAPTAWKSGPLPVGWQPIEIRWRQGSRGAVLRVGWLNKSAPTTPLTIAELRAVQVPPWLMTIDASANSAQTIAFERNLRTLASGGGAAAQALTQTLAQTHDHPWTAERITATVALADQVADQQQPPAAASITVHGPLAMALDLADRALDRARSEPLSPAGRQAVTLALRWLAHAADAAGEEPSTGSKRLRREVARIVALGVTADTTAEIRQIESECARLRKNLPSIPSADPPPTNVQPGFLGAAQRRTAVLAGRDRARTDLATACGSLALEVRESLPAATQDADALEGLETRLRHAPVANEPPRAAGDATALAELRSCTTRLLAGPAQALAMIALAHASQVATDAGARRLATALARTLDASRRLAIISERPTEAVPEPPPATPPPRPEGLTDAGFARAHPQAPTLNDHGINGFRPDQQAAIRAYLARIRASQPVTP